MLPRFLGALSFWQHLEVLSSNFDIKTIGYKVLVETDAFVKKCSLQITNSMFSKQSGLSYPLYQGNKSLILDFSTQGRQFSALTENVLGALVRLAFTRITP